MAIGKNFYQDFTERRENTYRPQTLTKNTVDNSSSVMYNKGKKNTGTITPSTDFANQWKEKNQGLFKYAGDGAKNSVDKGLKEAPDYMKDADEGTSFENVQTASVKRHLAQDSNNDKLHQSALMEMIGHLSKDNKETYLKHAQPLQTYIDTKDEFDFKHNNYTTTGNVDKTPNEDVRQLQRELNEAGYTDKFGQKLKEDGIYAGKTAYAGDRRRANNTGKTKTNINNYSTITDSKRYDVVALNANGEEFESPMFASASGPMLDIQTIKNFYKTNSTENNSKINQYKPGYAQKKLKEAQTYGIGTEKKNDARQTYNYIAKKAEELGLPLDLCLATAFKESSFKHYEKDSNGNITINESAGDYGLMQININAHPQAFNNKETYGDIINNWHDNVDYGLYYLKQCYEEAKIYGYTGNDLIKATYSNYNSGSCSAYKNPAHDAYGNVNGFWNVYTNKDWMNLIN